MSKTIPQDLVEEMSELELLFATLWDEKYPEIDLYLNHLFYPGRKFEIDFANPETKVGVEIQGGIYLLSGGHNTPSGLLADYTKLSHAASLGWIVFLLAEDMLTDYYLKMIAEMIKCREENHNSSKAA